MTTTRTASESPSVSYKWKRWVAEHKMRRVADADLIRFMTAHGVDEPAALREVGTAGEHPYVAAGAEKAEALLECEDLLDIYGALARLSPDFGTVERKSGLSSAEFLRDHYARNHPVILTDVVRDRNARWPWTPEYLKQHYGSVPVEIVAGRSSDPEWDVNFQAHTRSLPLGEYVDMVRRSGETNDHYLVARNFFFARDGVKGLLDDVSVPEYLSLENRMNVRLWFGPAGTVTPMHRDFVNVLMAQVYGRKLVKLVPSYEAHLVYCRQSTYSEVDCEQPDYDRHPRFREATVLDVVVEPGEALFIPAGWWHHVRALDVSISLSLVDFAFANAYPSRRR